MAEEGYYQKFLNKRVIITTIKNVEYKGRVIKIYDSWLWLKREHGKNYLVNQILDFKEIRDIEVI